MTLMANQDYHGAGSSSPRELIAAKASGKSGDTGHGNGEEQAQLNERSHRWARSRAIAKIYLLAGV